ncbi:MAG: hypothetical protein ACKVY0_29625 [Prosthecobacter sp.]|uniref:hypothetical protein n=1 Tax=Prosthecobacter sp. TaxID=1965333 RepID=UPI0038FE6047
MRLRLRGFVTLVVTLSLALHAQEQDKPIPAEPLAVQDARAAIKRKMDAIHLPELRLHNATLKQAIELLSTRSRELDKTNAPAGHKGVNIRLHPEAEPDKASISLDLINVPLYEALRYVTELAQMKFKVEADAVLVIPLWVDASEKFTRTFKVPTDFLSSNMDSGAPAAPADPFAIPQPEPSPSKGKIARQSSKQILETMGITFPEGSFAFFNPATGLLTVTNTQPNLDLVEAFFDTIHVHYSRTLAHQLIILEGPGELIRQINAAASRNANAIQELATLLDYAKNPGSNVRVVADAFLEGKSGTHAATTAVREHVHATDLTLDTKSRATAAWDLRPLGLVLEVEPTLGADGITIDNSLVVKLHPTTPRIRQFTATEPLTDRDAEFPFSVTAGAEFTTSLVSTGGATKLIGVTKPVGLADEKADVLWAAFLTSSIRRVQMLPQAKPSQMPAAEGMVATAFHAPPGLLESLMETTSQPLREWLEKVQGITFPPRAVLEQKGDQLHVINTPAMIEAIGALIGHAEQQAAKTIAFTLHTIEAPAALLRDLSRQSTATGADDTAIFTAAEAAVARGEARFIDSLFLETKSGLRATHESVREHVFISSFDLNAQNQPEVTFEMRKIGTIFEVEPVVGADGHTVELNFSHELHPAAPEARGAHFRDPASGQRFAMPATDFHVLKTTSGLTLTKGSTKLIALQQPTGRNAGAKLWATFLKCDVVPQIIKPRRMTAAKATELPDTDKQETKTYHVPRDFLNRMNNPVEPDNPSAPEDPFGAPNHRQPVRQRHSAPQPFERLGVTFPEGASASYNPATSTLVVRNTPRNLALIEAWLDELIHTSPATLVFTTHVLQAPGPLLRRLTAQAASKSNHRAELDELLAAVKAGNAQSLGTNRIETKPGVIARTQQGTEHTALADVRISKEGAPEIITETRNVGFKVELEAIIGADSQLVDLNIAPEFHTAAPFEHREHILDTQGRRLEFPLTDYHVAKTTTGITMPDGTVRLLSLYKPTGKPEFEKEDILQAIFITCDILRAGE